MPVLAHATELWRLTPREREITALVVQGYANKDISLQLGCAVKTVEMHVSNVMRKAGAHARAELVSIFWRLRREG